MKEDSRMVPQIGVITSLKERPPYFKELLDFGLDVCQLVGWESTLWSEKRAEEVRSEAEASGVTITSFWTGWPGPWRIPV